MGMGLAARVPRGTLGVVSALCLGMVGAQANPHGMPPRGRAALFDLKTPITDVNAASGVPTRAERAAAAAGRSPAMEARVSGTVSEAVPKGPAATPESRVPKAPAKKRQIIVSVPDQRLVLLEDGVPRAQFAVSTSKYGEGDRFGSYRTPLGRHVVTQKIGEGAEPGTVFKARSRTGEILKPNTGGRDPIVTRIIWLRGLEPGNANAQARGIYIHGTPQEARIGRKASYGCIRMRSADVIALFNAVEVGDEVLIVDVSARRAVRELANHKEASPPTS